MANKNKESTPTTKDGSKVASEQGRRRGLLTMALIPLVSIGALVGGMVAAMGVDGIKGLISTSAEASTDDGHSPPKASSGGHGSESALDYSVIDFDEMIMNIGGFTATGKKTTRFMKIRLSLIYDLDADGVDTVVEQQPFMRDAFQDYLRQLTERDLEGSIGLVRLREELVRRARAIAGSEAPREILIGDLIIQ